MLQVKIAVGGVENGLFQGVQGGSVRIFVGRSAIMRRFEHTLRLDEVPIGEIKINVKSRDDIPALLLGLQHLYVSCREELEGLLGCHVTVDRDPENGRPGMTLWRVLVMAVLKQGLDCDYDRLGELVNHHQVVRKMLQHGFLDDWTYSVRTVADNVSLVTPALLQELNALLVRGEGHAVAGKPPGGALDGRVDSFVVETDVVHYPTDVNLLWDAMRVLLTEVPACCGSHGVSGRRQGRYWRNQVRQGYQRVSRAQLWCRRPKAVEAWLTLCGDLTGHLGDTLEELAGLPEDSVSPAQLSRWCWFHTCSVRLQDRIRRRRAGRGNDPARGETLLAVRAAYALDHEGQGRQTGGAGGSPDGAGRSASVSSWAGTCSGRTWTWTWRFRWWRRARRSIRNCAAAVSTGGSTAPPTNSNWPRCWSTSRCPRRGAARRPVRAREGTASFVARRQRHPGVESAIHALESHGLDRVRTHGRAGFERTVGISILAANLHRLGRLLQQRAARQSHRTHAPPYRLAA